jgi:hypothetical protein
MAESFTRNTLTVAHQHSDNIQLDVEVESGFAFEQRLDGWNVLRLTRVDANSEEGNTTVEFGMPPADLERLAHALLTAAADARAAQTKFLRNRIQAGYATADCISGNVGGVQFEFVGPSPRNIQQTYVINVTYFNDVPGDEGSESSVLHRIEGIEVVIPGAPEYFWEFVSSYVGGRHQFTNSIAMKFKDAPEYIQQILAPDTPV